MHGQKKHYHGVCLYLVKVTELFKMLAQNNWVFITYVVAYFVLLLYLLQIRSYCISKEQKYSCIHSNANKTRIYS